MKKFRFLTMAIMALSLPLCSCGVMAGVNAEKPSDYGADTAQKHHFEYKKHGADDDTDIWYSDDFFKNPSTEYNPHLATLSMHMAKYSQNPGGPSSTTDQDWYDSQWHRVAAFWNAIGFGHVSANVGYKTRTAFDTIGVACASRNPGDYTVIACTVRSVVTSSNGKTTSSSATAASPT